MNKKFLFLSSTDIKDLLSMNDAIDAMKYAFTSLNNGDANVPQRTSLSIPDENGEVLFMPSNEKKSKITSLKIVSVYKDNPLKDLPAINAMIFLMNAENGTPLAIMDGEYITAMRTGAVSGLATDLLARKNSQIAALFGTGVQAAKQLEAIDCVRNLKKVYIFGLTHEDAINFVEKNKNNYSFELLAEEDKSVISNCDIICTATSSYSPVFEDSYVNTGTHINSIGSYKPEMNEIPEDTIVRSKVVVDSLSACLNEAGDIIKPIKKEMFSEDQIYAELGEIVATKKIGRENEKEITVFKSVGIAIQDLAAAYFVYSQAIKNGKGNSIKL